jgi:DNA-binding transcriptional ArsR family regulator
MHRNRLFVLETVDNYWPPAFPCYCLAVRQSVHYPPMLEHLFGSKSRYKLLRFFFRHQDDHFYVRELTRALGLQINAIRRELEVLLKAGIIDQVADKDASTSSRKKFFGLDKTSLLYPELSALLLKDSMLGEQAFFQTLKKKSGNLILLLVSGFFTGEPKAPTDIFFVGTVKERVVTKLISEYEKECGHAIRYTIMTEQEFSDRRHVMDKFLFELFEAKNIRIVDTID